MSSPCESFDAGSVDRSDGGRIARTQSMRVGRGAEALTGRKALASALGTLPDMGRCGPARTTPAAAPRPQETAIMNIGQHCRHAVIGIDEGCTLRDAAMLMREHHVGALVVTTTVADQRDAVGVVTDRDIADAVAAHGLSPADVLVGAVAMRPPHFIRATASPAEVAFAMRRAGVRRLLLVDEEEGVVGLVSADDLLAILMEPLMALSHLATAERDNERTLAGLDSRIQPLALRMRETGLRRPDASPLHR